MPDLTGSSAVDVAIGLAFVYLLFSLLCSAIQEAIASIFDLRAATLEKGLRNLLEDGGEAGKNGAPTAAGASPPRVATDPRDDTPSADGANDDSTSSTGTAGLAAQVLG